MVIANCIFCNFKMFNFVNFTFIETTVIRFHYFFLFICLSVVQSFHKISLFCFLNPQQFCFCLECRVLAWKRSLRDVGTGCWRSGTSGPTSLRRTDNTSSTSSSSTSSPSVSLSTNSSVSHLQISMFFPI